MVIYLIKNIRIVIISCILFSTFSFFLIHLNPNLNTIKSNYTSNNGKTLIQKANDELNIAIFYDNNYSSPWISYSEELALSLNESLYNLSLNCSIYDDNELLGFIDTNPDGILIVPMGILPYSLWNGSENSQIEQWLDNGGIIFWTGCEEFYWLSYSNGTNRLLGHAANKVLDMEYLVVRSNQNVNPTDIGNYYVPNLISHTTDIFSSLKLLEENSIYYEAYCKNGELADPILFQPKNGNGYFIRVHADWIDNLDSDTIKDWIISILVNRFLSHPIINLFEFKSKILLYDLLIFNLTLSNYNDSSFVYNITIESNSFEDLEIENILNNNELNKRIKINISCELSAIPKDANLILRVLLNKSLGADNLQIYYKNLTIKIEMPLNINITFFPNIAFPSQIINLNIDLYNYLDFNLDISILLFSNNLIYEHFNLINITPGMNSYNLDVRISWISSSGNFSVKLIIYHGTKTLEIQNIYLLIKSYYENPFFIVLLITILLSLISIIILIYYIRNRFKQMQNKIYNELIKRKSINLSEFCQKNKINLKRFEILLRALINKYNNLKYIIKEIKNKKIILKNSDEFKQYLENYIEENENISFSQLESMVYISNKKLKNLLENLI